MTSELLQQARVLDPVTQTDRIADVLIEDGTIIEVADTIPDYPAETVIYECQECILGPGLVDLYSHSGEPGFEDRETLESLLRSAAAGGFTRVAILPDTAPSMDNPASIVWFQERQKAIRRRESGVEGIEATRETERHSFERSQKPESTLFDKGDALQNLKLQTQNTLPEGQSPTKLKTLASFSTPHLYLWAALTADVQGQQMTELAELSLADIAGFADGRSLNNMSLVRHVLEYLQSLQKPVALWACDRELAGNGVMREGQESIQLGLPGVPAIAETAALSSLLECIETMGTPVHLMRISTARGVDLVRAAKSRGLPITASTTWMHLLLNSQAIASYDSSLRLDPPLGNPADQIALLDGLRDGVLDAIAIDHTPHTYEDKTVAFSEAPPGAIGLELALPLLWQSLVELDHWPALDLWRLLSTNPAQCLQQKPAAIARNQPTELTLFDPHQTWNINPQSLHSRSANTPWLNQTITGRVLKIWCPLEHQGLKNSKKG